jgi:hypothetical protein
VNTTGAWKRRGNLEHATFEAELIPRVEHARAELETVIREGIQLEHQNTVAYEY